MAAIPTVNQIGNIKFQPSSLWQFCLGALVLYLIATHVPDGTQWAILILLGAILATPDAIQKFTDLVSFIETGK